MWIPVKYFLSVLLRALRRARHFALGLKMCRSNQGSLVISIQVGNSVRPMHLFGPNLEIEVDLVEILHIYPYSRQRLVKVSALS